MATRPSKTTTPETPREPTFNLADLERLVAEGVAKALAAREPERPARKSDQSTKNEIAAMKAFKKRGFGIIKPHIDTRTFNRWVAEGLRPKEGEHAVPVANLRLFHRSQCRPLTAEEQAGFKTKNDERVAAAKAKIVSITEAGAQQ
jgi:hypothetical protein